MTHLAAYLEQTKKLNSHVLLIDADLEAPGITYWLDVANQPSISFVRFLEAVHYPPTSVEESIQYCADELRKSSLTLNGTHDVFVLPACIDPNEPIPTLEECETKWNELVSSGFIQRLFEPPYYVKREQAYLDAGITMTRVNELTAEYTFALASNDTELIEKYKTQLDEIQSQRLSIKNQFPKPE
jgi:hypothetical protein